MADTLLSPDPFKWLNPGIAELWDITSGVSTTKSTNTSYTLTGYYTEIIKDNSLFKLVNTEDSLIKTNELWFSYDYYVYGGINSRMSNLSLLEVKDKDDKTIVRVQPEERDSGYYLTIYDDSDTLLYTSDLTYNIKEKAWHNIEFHVKFGDSGRIDIWIDTKLFCSFRTPSAFADKTMWKVGIHGRGRNFYGHHMYVSSIIMQNTRRIGLEKFKMLTVDPSTEQNMPQGSTTNFTISGLSDSTEFSDITAFGAVLEATSRDANISTGTFSLEGADIGTIDVSDSSGKAYEIATTTTNSLTEKAWTRDDIEGKTLSFKVNEAS